MRRHGAWDWSQRREGRAKGEEGERREKMRGNGESESYDEEWSGGRGHLCQE